MDLAYGEAHKGTITILLDKTHISLLEKIVSAKGSDAQGVQKIKGLLVNFYTEKELELEPPSMKIKNLSLSVDDDRKGCGLLGADSENDENNCSVYTSSRVVTRLIEEGTAWAESSAWGHEIHLVYTGREKRDDYPRGSIKDNLETAKRLMASQRLMIIKNRALDDHAKILGYKRAPYPSGLLLARIYSGDIDVLIPEERMTRLQTRGVSEGYAITPGAKRRFLMIIDDKLARQDFSFGAYLAVDDNKASLYLSEEAGKSFFEKKALKRKLGQKAESTATITALSDKNPGDNPLYDKLEFYATRK